LLIRHFGNTFGRRDVIDASAKEIANILVNTLICHMRTREQEGVGHKYSTRGVTAT